MGVMETVLRRLALYESAAQEALDVLTAFHKLAVASVIDIAKLMATLSGTPARVLDPLTGESARSESGASWSPSKAPVRLTWPCAPVLAGEPPAMWLEREDELRVLDAAILQAAAEAMLSLRGESDPPAEELTDILIDVLTASNPIKQEKAIERIALHPASLCRVVAQPGNVAQILVSPPRGPLAAPNTPLMTSLAGHRIGISPLSEARELPNAWKKARTALAFAAAGTASDPGAQLVPFEDLGVWADLVPQRHPDSNPPSDVQAINKLEDEASWAIQTLAALTESTSVREAAARLFTHHSTIQARQAVLEKRLGWNVATPAGRTRTSMALALRRYLLHPVSDEPPKSANPPVLFVSPDPPSSGQDRYL